MGNQILDKLSRFLLPPSLVSCHFRSAIDVIESSIISTKNFHDSSSIKPQLPPKFKNFHSSPNLSLCSKDKERAARQSKTKNSSTSYGGWFSSEDEEEAETERKNEAVFSSSSRSSPSFCRRIDRKAIENDPRRYDGDYFSFKVSASSTNISGKLRRETAKTRSETTQTCLGTGKNSFRTENDGSHQYSKRGSQYSTQESSAAPTDWSSCRKTAQTRRLTTSSSRRVEKKMLKEKSSNRHSIESTTPTDLYYSDLGSLVRKTTKTSRKTSKKLRKRNSGLDFEVGTTKVGKVEGSYAVEMSSCNPYSDFRASMVEMITVEQIFGEEDLGRLLQSFLALNSHCHHQIIFEVFSEVCETLFTC